MIQNRTINRRRIRTAQAALCAALAAIALTSGGCSQRVAAPVDADLARTTLSTVLDAWKEGKQPADLRKRAPEIVVQDPDWSARVKLKSYEVIGPGKALDANLQCEVRLTVEDAEANESEKTVTYVVGTDPVLTVFRDLFQ